MARLNGIYVLALDTFEEIYGPKEQRQISELVNLVSLPISRDMLRADLSILKDVDVLFSGWGAPVLDRELLAAAPNLKTVFYGAGAIGYMMTDEAWQRGICITTANAANAVPVAEYCLGTIFFSLKQGWRLARETRMNRRFPDQRVVQGAYGSTVGLVSMGTVGRALRNLLRPFDLHVLAYDPFISDAEAAELNIERVSLDEIFKRADVVSIHTPLLDETRGLVRGSHVASMKKYATLINTSRGPVIRHDEFERVLAQRPDLTAILDVTDPEPPAISSILYDLPNVIVTPHIAGSLGNECRRMGATMVEELRRYVAHQPLQWIVTPQMAAHSSHRPVQRHAALAVA